MLTTVMKDPLTVIVVSDHGWVNGGQAKVAIDSALALAGQGIDVCFVAGCGPLDERLLEAPIECHVAGDHDILSDPNRLRASASGIWNRAAARVLAGCIEGRDPRRTVIHVHGWAKALSPSIGPVVTKSRAAHVYTLHDYSLACPNGGFFDYQASEICKRRALGVDCLRTNCDSRSPAHKAWRVARQATLWRAGHMPGGLREIIYLAPEQRSIMAPYMPAEARWHLLPNPAGPRQTQRVAAEDNDNFLFIGRLSSEKGAEIAARAASLAGVPIEFCGEGECRDAVLRANPNAKMLGWLDADALSERMRRARCLVFPSLWYECYPLVVSDALRAGVPVLASDSSLGAAIFPDGVAGRHVRTGDVQAWAEGMTTLRSDALVRSYSEGALRVGDQLPGRQEYVAGLVEIYRAALSRKQLHEFANEESSW